MIEKRLNWVCTNGKLSSVGVCMSSKAEQLPLVVSPDKEVRPSSKQSVVTQGFAKSRLGCVSINWLSQSSMIAEICKYESQESMIPKTQEDQLESLMDKFSLTDLKAAYFVTSGKIGVERRGGNSRLGV
jgi:hypothetical protein